MKQYNIALTGANGYIGSYLKQFLTSRGHSIYSMLRQPHSENKILLFELGKQNNYDTLTAIDVLIHCAYDFSQPNYQKSRTINLNGTLDLFAHAKKSGVKKLIYISSTSAFSGAVSNYGKIKYETEEQLKQFDAIIVRPGLVFSKNAGGIIGAMRRFIARFGVAPLIGKGDQLFFPCHVDDLAHLLERLLEVDHGMLKAPIIAASDQAIRFKELVLRLAKAQHKAVRLIPLPYWLLFSGLKMAELFNIKLGLRSDSLKYMKHYNKHLDFTAIQRLGVPFRAFTTDD